MVSVPAIRHPGALCLQGCLIPPWSLSQAQGWCTGPSHGNVLRMFSRRKITVRANNIVWKKVSFSDEKNRSMVLAGSHLPPIADTPCYGCVEHQELSLMWFWKFCVEWLALSFHGGEVSPCQSAKHSVRSHVFCPYIKLSFGSSLADGGSWHYSNMLFISWSLLISPGCCCNSTISPNKLITTQDLLNMKPQKPGSTCDLEKALPVGCFVIIFPPSWVKRLQEPLLLLLEKVASCDRK